MTHTVTIGREIEYDVLVCGGGPSRITAAFNVPGGRIGAKCYSTQAGDYQIISIPGYLPNALSKVNILDMPLRSMTAR